MSRTLKTVFACLLFALFGGNQALAENSQDFGDYVVHYNALTTDFLSPEVARHYGITRSKNRAMLNITVLKKGLGLAAHPVKATVSARAVNLNQQIKALSIREVNDGNAIYYIAEFPVDHGETLDFDIQAEPIDGGRRMNVRFRQQFFVD